MADDNLSLPMDYNIKSNTIRLVDEVNGTTIISRDEAIQIAKSQNKNLVQISFNKSVYPGSICKIIDYAKYKYDQKKKAKEIAKKNRAARAELKEISFSIRIDDNDKKRNIEHIRQFLEEGNKVKVSVFLAKREMDKTQFAKALIKEVVDNFNDYAEFDSPPSFEGRTMSCVLRKIKK